MFTCAVLLKRVPSQPLARSQSIVPSDGGDEGPARERHRRHSPTDVQEGVTQASREPDEMVLLGGDAAVEGDVLGMAKQTEQPYASGAHWQG